MKEVKNASLWKLSIKTWGWVAYDKLKIILYHFLSRLKYSLNSLNVNNLSLILNITMAGRGLNSQLTVFITGHFF